MSAMRLLLTWLTAACWGVGAFLMQTVAGDHMAFSLAAVLAGVIALGVALVPLQSVLGSSIVLSAVYVVAAVILAVIAWDWRSLAAGLAYAAAGAIGLVAYGVDIPRAAQGPAVAESGAGGGGPRRLIAAYRRRRPGAARPAPGQGQAAAEPDGDGGK